MFIYPYNFSIAVHIAANNLHQILAAYIAQILFSDTLLAVTAEDIAG